MVISGKSEDQNMKLIIPEDEKFRIITACHITSGAQLGVDKTVNKISDRYYWKGIYKDVRDFARNCDSCQKSKKKAKNNKTRDGTNNSSTIYMDVFD
jgi:hypothetical protein